jgi:hypothetical protein
MHATSLRFSTWTNMASAGCLQVAQLIIPLDRSLTYQSDALYHQTDLLVIGFLQPLAMQRGRPRANPAQHEQQPWQTCESGTAREGARCRKCTRLEGFVHSSCRHQNERHQALASTSEPSQPAMPL